MRIIPFDASHIDELQLQPRQSHSISHLSLPYVLTLQKTGVSASAEHEGKIIGCAGILPVGFGLGHMWSLSSVEAAPHFVKIHRCLRRLIDLADLRRIEATAEVDFKEACRFLELLNFGLEGIKRKYGLDGKDHCSYGWVR